MDRRTSIKYSLLGIAGLSSSCLDVDANSMTNSKIYHSACRWCYNDIPLELFAEQAKDIGVQSIELLDPEEWSVVLDKGLSCAISNGSKLGITKGFNDPNNHEQLKADYSSLIPRAADHGIKQIICFNSIT